MIWAISAGQPDLVVRARRALGAGLHRLLIREANATPEWVDLAAEFGERVVLHARMPGVAGIAAATGSGVHLPGDADVVAWRGKVAGPLGKSCHSAEEAHAALAAGCDWAFLSPIFSPISKPSDHRPPLGPEGLSGLIALGGIRLDRLAVCRAHGAVGAATISHVLNDPDPARAAAAWRACWEASG